MSRERTFRRGGRRWQERDLRHWADRMRDIVVAAKECLAYTAGMTEADFRADVRTQKAVLMNLIIIGEAARFMPLKIVASHPGVAWDDLRELRNFVVHVYFRVEARMVWETVRGELPGIVKRLEGVASDPSRLGVR